MSDLDAIERRFKELAALSRLIAIGSEDRTKARLWRRIANLWERSNEMDVIFTAFEELISDKSSLLDPDTEGHSHSAVFVSLERDDFGGFSINVALKDLEGGQIAYVLDVARRAELEVRESRGYLRLAPHLTSADLSEDAEPETVEA